MTPLPRHGLYAITDSTLLSPSRLETAVESAIRGGAAVIQYRDKGTDLPRRRREAAALAVLCRSRGVPLIVNDDIELARVIAADGVHVGRDDQSLESARAALGPQAIIGVSCYDSMERALRAQSAGANYVAFGRFFSSRTKPEAIQANLQLLRDVRSRIAVPIVAIGGITSTNGAALLDAGADLLAVIHSVFGHRDPKAAAREYLPLFEGRLKTA